MTRKTGGQQRPRDALLSERNQESSGRCGLARRRRGLAVNDGQENDECQADVVRWENAQRAPPVKVLEGVLFAAQVEKDSGYQETRYCEEEVHADPAQLRSIEKMLRCRPKVDTENSQDSNQPKAVEFRNPLHVCATALRC
jgi:hypothetical protein